MGLTRLCFVFGDDSVENKFQIETKKEKVPEGKKSTR